MSSDPSSLLQARAGEADIGRRLDSGLATAFPEVSRSRFQSLIADGRVTVEGKTVISPRHKLNAGEEVTVSMPAPKPAAPVAEAMALSIVHEDSDLIVIDKPAGIVVHPGAGHEGGTLVNALLAHCGDSLSGIAGVKRPGIVHRLDKDTSGLLVVAKSDAAHKGLSEQFASHGRDGRLERAYLAFVWGIPERSKATISAALSRSTANRKKIAVSKAIQAREAVTHYRLVEKFGTVASLIECRLETGRTHQIRVHMAHIGHPLLGDPAYGKGFASSARKLSQKARKVVESLNRQALHAAILGFEHPVTGKQIRFESPLPADLEKLLLTLREP
jgi:23S rRNA pseudouridine1911/1915/1917 synthase